MSINIFLKQNKRAPKLKIKIQLNLEQSDTILLAETSWNCIAVLCN